MINIIGKTLDDAKKVLNENNLTLGNVTEQEQDGPEGVIISQSVKPGDPVESGSAIDVVVSKKPSPPVLKNVTIPLPDIPGEMKVVVVKKMLWVRLLYIQV